ncbi:MAG: carbon-nitrogen hydrolase family protein [Steroidobacteraceae bacterium]
MRPFSIAGVQMHVNYGQDNTPMMRHKLDVLMLRFPSVEMVVFSELAAFGPSMAHAQTLPGPAENAFCEMARRYGVWLIPGSLFEIADGVIYNTASIINPDGVVVGRHRKMFPFAPHEIGVTGGKDFFVWDIAGVGRFGISICYDMWFPETTRTLAAMGAEVILHPTMTDTIDRDVELSISRASAAMNQCFFFDVNGVGGGGNGRSIVVRPTGTVLHTAGDSEEFFPVDIDLNVARRCRTTGMFGLGQPLKSFRDRKVDFTIYKTRSPAKEYLASLGPLVKPGRHPDAAPIPLPPLDT